MPDSSPRRVDGSMSLLVDMTTASLDPSYAAAADRRRREAETGAPASARRTSVLLLVALGAVGVITGTAAAQVRRDAQQVDAARSDLVADVQARTRETDRLADTATGLRAELADVRTKALGQDGRGQAAATELARLELVTGAVAVRGPGLVVTLDDAATATSDGGAGDRGGQLGDGRIYDRDVQDVVNALWLAGAEAMSVNGLRLTAQTAIRSAGEAVLVDFRPLTPPYVLRAVGDPEAMEPAFADGPTARRFQTWTSLYGLRFDVAAADDLRLPAAADPELRSVEGSAP